MKKLILALGLALAFFSASAQQYDVAAYLYPAYAAGDPRLRPFWPMGMGEWETVLTMQQRYPGHDWDRHPLWGYINEADPAVMEMEIDQATSHGVNVFIFDWYWFDGRPWMETTLTEGFLKARNRDKMQFYLMWANHNVDNSWDTRIAPMWEPNIIYRGGVDREEFEKICKRNIELFFKQPNYYKIDGKPVFMIYEVSTFIEGIGGVDAAVDALKWFRNEVKKAGFPDLELQFAMWDSQFNYSGVDEAKVKAGKPRDSFIRNLGFNSMSHYQFCHFIDMDNDYGIILNRAYQEWDKLDAEFTIPYYPHVSIGWDNSPRYRQSAVVKENTPERFEDALRKAKAWVDARPGMQKLITINSWNEWTETSYLQPDDVYGYGYLDAVKHVFVDESPKQRAKHVVLVGIDGWAAEAVRQAPAADLPNLHYLMDHGAWTLSKRSVMPSASAINWASTFNGLPTEMHGFDKWNSTHGTIPSTSDNGHGIPPTLFTLLREQHPKAVTGALFDWDGIGPVTDTLAMSWHHWLKTYTSKDEVIVPLPDYTKIATDYIKANKPEFFFLYYGTLDEAGHIRGWYSDGYMDRQRQLDAEIGRVMAALKEAGIWEDTVFILTADHGGTGTGHGGFTLLELETPFVVVGNGIKEGFEITQPMMIYDTPAVIADILGVSIPADWRGRPFPEIYR